METILITSAQYSSFDSCGWCKNYVDIANRSIDRANPYKDLHEIKKFMLGPESRALLFLQAKNLDT